MFEFFIVSGFRGSLFIFLTSFSGFRRKEKSVERMFQEYVEVSSSSEPEIEELLKRDEELERELEEIRSAGMARTREGGFRQSEIDEYLQRPDGHERARERRSSEVGATSSGRGLEVGSGRVPRVVPTGKWLLDKGVWVEEPWRSMTSKEI